ncbi:MAG: hypothetical protein ABIP71_12690 [Verrucomicrobiota bacterium]
MNTPLAIIGWLLPKAGRVASHERKGNCYKMPSCSEISGYIETSAPSPSITATLFYSLLE